MSWLGRRNWIEAEKVAAAQLVRDPDDESASADLAEALRRQARFFEALGVCTSALARKPSARLYFSRALVELELKHVDAARLSLAAAANGIDPTVADDPDSVFLVAGIAGGAALVYESRNLKRQAAERRANRS